MATCTERSPIRSSSLTIRSADTTTRRSPATGCWSESRENAVSSTRSRARSTLSSAAMTGFGHLGVAVEEGLGGETDRRLDLAADLRQVLEDRVELVVEGFAHAGTVGGEGDQQGPDGERLVNSGQARLAEANPR